MGNKVLIFISVLVTLLGMTFSGSDSYAQAKGSSVIVNFAYAQETIHQGGVWKIYLSVSDPEGNMSRIVFHLEQDGGTRFSRPDTTYLKKGMEKGFTGYFAFPTTGSTDNLWGEELNLNVAILDRGGNELKTLDFPLKFDGEAMKPLPPDLEKDLNQRLGTIHIGFIPG